MKNYGILFSAFVLGALMFFGSFNSASRADEREIDANKLEFYLVTVEVGDRIADNFGHTGIRIHNLESGQDLVLNWGLYDFREPWSFALRFYLGDLTYKLGAYSFSRFLQQYEYERRTVWEDKLLLTPEEKKILWNRLKWNLEPQNRNYQYQYFFDNCSTRPRDYIDEALQGIGLATYSNKDTGETFRTMVRTHYQTNPFVQFGLEVLMNSRLDRSMTAWEKMFLPKTLRDLLLTLKRADGSAVMEASKTHTEYSPPKPFSLSGGQFFALGILGGCGFAWILWRRLNFKKTGIGILSLILIAYGFYAGLLGLLMTANWIFSGHPDLYHNANLWFFWPADFYFVYLGLKMARGCFTSANAEILALARKRLLRYLGLHLATLGLAASAWTFNLIGQDIHLVFTYVGLCFGIILVTTLRFHFQDQ